MPTDPDVIGLIVYAILLGLLSFLIPYVAAGGRMRDIWPLE